MFRIEMLPAAHGDCIWIEYGTGGNDHRILIDGGPAHTYPALRDRILLLPEDKRTFELLVITHIDADHIEGVIRLLQDAPALNCVFERIWFNGQPQLDTVPDPAGPPLGALQGEILGMLIYAWQEQSGTTVWNTDFDNGIAAVDRHKAELPAVTLPGDCRLTVLSPDHERLLGLKDHWHEEMADLGVTTGDAGMLRVLLGQRKNLAPLGDVLGDDEEAMADRYELPRADGRDRLACPDDVLGGWESGEGATAFGTDSSVANGASIAFLLEYPADKPTARFLLAGDAWPSVIVESLDLLLNGDEQLNLNGLKLPHHGSTSNVTQELLKKIRCKHYLVSTSGAVFRHPNTEAVELLLKEHNGRARPCLHFNYLTSTTEEWNNTERQKEERFDAYYPKGIILTL